VLEPRATLQRIGVCAGAGARRPFLLGDAFSAADVLVGHMLVWADSLALLAGHDKLADYATRIRARPASGAPEE